MPALTYLCHRVYKTRCGRSEDAHIFLRTVVAKEVEHLQNRSTASETASDYLAPKPLIMHKLPLYSSIHPLYSLKQTVK